MELNMKPEQSFWYVWREGYQCTGEHEQAHLMGVIAKEVAPTFEDACRMAGSNASQFDPERLTVWGCRLFDNEEAARKSFG